MNACPVQTKKSIRPSALQQLLAAGSLVDLIDVRTPAEYVAAHVPGARLIPLDRLDAAALAAGRGVDDHPIYILCQSGGRARKAIEFFEKAGFNRCILVEGGIQAWIDAGLPVRRGERQTLPLMRQVQIVVGLVSATGAVMALVVHPLFVFIPLLTGCGLLFAGLTGHCMLAVLLGRMPWNQSTHCACSIPRNPNK